MLQTDPLSALLFEAMLDHAAGHYETVAGRHGKLRARDDRTLAGLLNEYAALRRRLAASGDVGVALQSALDHAGAVAASAFCIERARQQEVLRRGQDHALRSGVNAIRLAAFVQRQTGRDTAEVVERHTTSLAAMLDQARDSLAPRDDLALRPDRMPSADLVAACRQQTLEWNGRHPALRCTFAATSCVGRFDTARVRETLDAMVEAAARQAGTGAALSVSVGSDQGMARVTVEGVAQAGMRRDPGLDTPAEALVWRLARQTAADHHGSLAIEPAAHRVALRLMLRHEAAALGD